MDDQEAYEILLRNTSNSYSAVSNPKRLKILIELRKYFLEGMKWPQLRESTGLSSGALKRHINVLMESGLIGKVQSYYRISEPGLKLLMQGDQVAEELRKFQMTKKGGREKHEKKINE